MTLAMTTATILLENKPTNSHIEISWDSYPASRPNTMRCSNYPVMIQDRATTDVWVAFYVIKIAKLHLPWPLSRYSSHSSDYLRWPGNVNTFDTARSCEKKGFLKIRIDVGIILVARRFSQLKCTRFYIETNGSTSSFLHKERIKDLPRTPKTSMKGYV